ncbi:hypothetical protein PR003_g29054 [Phytophthora rubi]|nr:hypothetical protein PR003_g29054 [Phytophthora rubi]
MTRGSGTEGSMQYRDSEDMDFDDAINAFLNEYSPVEVLNGQDGMCDLLNAKDESFGDSLSSIHCQLEETDNSNSDRGDEEFLPRGRSRKRVKTKHLPRKAEIASLRAEAESLQAKLLPLQYKFAKTEASMKESMAGPVFSQSQQIWRRVALTQFDRRRKAEAENASLREMVALQVLEAKNLRRVLKRRTRIEMLEDTLGLKGMTGLLTQNPLTDSRIFQKLEQAADALFCRIDSLFAMKNMDALPFTGHSREANLDKINGAYYEVCQKRLVPFSIQETDRAVWRCLGSLGLTNMQDVGGPGVRFNCHSDPMEADDNTLQTTFSVVISGVEKLVGTYNQKVVRRYKDNERVVFICRVLSEPRFQSGQSGVSATTTTHIILEAPEESATDLTEMKIYFGAERDVSTTEKDTTAPWAIAAWDELVPRFAGDVETILLESNTDGC